MLAIARQGFSEHNGLPEARSKKIYPSVMGEEALILVIIEAARACVYEVK
jgi:hypothetical protein